MKVIDFLKDLWDKKSDTTASFVKDDEGQWWFFGIYSNKFMDFAGDILSEESHKEYIEWLKETGFQPALTVHHMPRAPKFFWPLVFEYYENDVKTLQDIVDTYYEPFAFAKAERVVYVNGFVAVVAKVLEGKEEIAEKLSRTSDLGMSHGFIDKESDVNIFYKYRTFEMSTLRSVRAANPFTLTQMLQKGMLLMKGQANDKGLEPEDHEFLVDLFGEAVVNKFVNKTGKAEPILSKFLEYKEDIMGGKQKEEAVETLDAPVTEEVVTPETETEAEAETVEEETPTEQPAEENKEETPVPQGLTLEVVAAETAKAFSQFHEVLTKMQTQLEKAEKTAEELRQANEEVRKQLKEQVKEVSEIKKTDDEKIASAWLPAFNWSAGYSPSLASDNVLKDDKEKEEILIAPPTGSTPVEVDVENPLYMGFWQQLPAIMSGK